VKKIQSNSVNWLASLPVYQLRKRQIGVSKEKDGFPPARE